MFLSMILIKPQYCFEMILLISKRIKYKAILRINPIL